MIDEFTVFYFLLASGILVGSAYTGGLWLACVYAAYDMIHTALLDSSPVKSCLASSADDRSVPWSKVAEEFHALLIRAKCSYEAALWTGNLQLMALIILSC